MKKVLKSFVFLFLIIIQLSFTGCYQKKEEVINFDNEHPLALAPDVNWALVTDPYASYKEQIGWASPVTGHCRQGEILQVLAKSLDKEDNYWYRFEQGWLPETCLTIYSNRYKAQNAAKDMK